MTTLVAGAAGFIGSHLCDRLLAEGCDVVGVDNLVTGRRENLSVALANPHFRFVEHDITTALPDLGPVNEIFHLASPASPSDFATIPLEILEVGSNGTKHLLQLAERQGARFLLASTSEIYGDPMVHPQPETYWGNVDSIGPRSCYDEAKRFAEAITMAYHRFHSIDTRIVRIFNTYGPRMRPNDGRVVSNFIVQAIGGQPLTVYGDGSQTRSFCFASDEVEGIFRLFDRGDAMPTNIGNPAEYTVGQLAEMITTLTGSTSPVEYRPLPTDDPKVRKPDITKARAQLGWEPTVDLKAGLTETIAYFRELLARHPAEARTL
jgi:dTDP-glucose 4,6-dehydratase